jgi:RimJ/RimL family protein N-acetyltransferase
MEILVRPARSADAATLHRIFAEAARTAWSHFLPEDELALLTSPGERWEQEAPPETTLVAELGGELVAFAVIRGSLDTDAEPGGTGEVETFYSLPSSWGRGVGKALLRAALDALRRQGYREATLWTAEQNARPRRIYEVAGFALDGTRRQKVFLGVKLTELRYRIAL